MIPSTVSNYPIPTLHWSQRVFFHPNVKHADLPFEKIVLLEPFYFLILFFLHSEETRHGHFRVAVNILCPVTQPLNGKVNNNKNSPTTCSLWLGSTFLIIQTNINIYIFLRGGTETMGPGAEDTAETNTGLEANSGF